jgi:hypothetical protein
MRLSKISAVAALMFGAATSANALTLSGDVTADNQFAIYWSTAANTLGTLIETGSNWQTNYAFSPVTLSGGTDYYINIVLTNWTPTNGYPQYQPSPTANPSAALGDFTLVGSGYEFLTGGQYATTNTAGWLGSTPPGTGTPGTMGYVPASWVQPSNPVTGYGTNGSNAIWYPDNSGPVAGIDSNASWIFYGDQATAQFADLQLAIVPSGEASPTPLPSTWSMLLAGFVGLGFIAYRSKKKGSEVAFAAA